VEPAYHGCVEVVVDEVGGLGRGLVNPTLGGKQSFAHPRHAWHVEREVAVAAAAVGEVSAAYIMVSAEEARGQFRDTIWSSILYAR